MNELGGVVARHSVEEAERSDPGFELVGHRNGPGASSETVIEPVWARPNMSSSYRWGEIGQASPFSLRIDSAMALADAPFDLVEVKLAAPLSRPGAVPKSDVIARLCASAVPLVSVVAPAGYGKTTLLASWAEADPRPFAWVALDRRDDDAVVLLRYIAAAVDRVEPLPDEVFDALSGPGGSSWALRVPRVGSALAALDRPLVLALDDLHAVANPSCLDVLAELLRYVPAGSQIAIASREEPPLPLARWRAEGSVLRDRSDAAPHGRAGGRGAARGRRYRARDR